MTGRFAAKTTILFNPHADEAVIFFFYIWVQLRTKCQSGETFGQGVIVWYFAVSSSDEYKYG